MNNDNFTWSEDLIEDIIENIHNRAIVPIIGDDAYYIKESEFSIQHFILDRVLKRKNLDNTYKAEDYQDGIKGYTRLSSRLLKDYNLILKKLIIQEFTKTDIKSRIRVRDDVKCFLNRGDFPLIISTSIYTILSEELAKEYNVVLYQKEQKSSQDISLSDDDIPERTIYNIFGNLATNIECVFTENDFLSYLHCLHDTNTYPKTLKHYLLSHYVLMLGCDIPDWTFRFLLYSLKANHGELKPKEGTGGLNSFVGGSISKKINEELEMFLSDISYLSSRKVSDFLRDVNRHLHPVNRPKLFLSCSHDDYEDVLDLKKKLSEKFDVWFCPEQTEERCGDKYWLKIRQGLMEADYFMPYVTDKLCFKLSDMDGIVDTTEPFQDSSKELGIVTEWKLALQYKCSTRTFPYILSNFDAFKRLLENKFVPLRRLFFPENGAQAITKKVKDFNPSIDI